MSIDQIFQALLGQGGSLLLLLLAVVAFYREWVVSGAAYRRLLRERDDARALAYRATGLSEKLLVKREQGDD